MPLYIPCTTESDANESMGDNLNTVNTAMEGGLTNLIGTKYTFVIVI